MISPQRQTLIADYNALYYGYPIEKLMENAGKGIAQAILKKYGKGKRIAFICGKGNNGGDGFVAARYIWEQAKPAVFLVGGAEDIRTPESRKNWERFKGNKYDNCTTRDILLDVDILVECLLGTGMKGKLKEPYASIVRRINKFRGIKISVDLPVPGYKPDLVISLMHEKIPGAMVVDIGYPAWLGEKIGIGEVKALNKPSDDSHKGDNGRLLIVGGSQQYHGAPLYAAQIASRIVDLVYFSSVPENNTLLQKMKSRSCEFIAIPREAVLDSARQVDAILIGPGMGISPETRTLTNLLLKKNPDQKFILDADALKVADPKLLNSNCIVTPHAGEFKSLFGIRATRESVLRMARKCHCTIVLKGKADYVSDGNELKVNETGNAGMTKGGTGDVLAGLTAALACNNDQFLAARAAVFLNGLAGDRLKAKLSYYYNASDLIRELPKAIKWCEDY